MGRMIKLKAPQAIANHGTTARMQWQKLADIHHKIASTMRSSIHQGLISQGKDPRQIKSSPLYHDYKLHKGLSARYNKTASFLSSRNR